MRGSKAAAMASNHSSPDGSVEDMLDKLDEMDMLDEMDKLKLLVRETKFD